MPSSKPSVREKYPRFSPVEKRELQAKILRLKRDCPDLSYAEVGARLGVDSIKIRHHYLSALKNIIRAPAEEIITLELERLDYLQSEVFKLLQANHVVVNQGRVMRDTVDDEHGNPIIDALTGKPLMRRVEDTGPKFAAVDRALKIMERRSKFLGLDKVQGGDNRENLTPEEFALRVQGAIGLIDQVSGSGE